MKFLLDVCASSRALQQALVDQNRDARSVYEIDPKASDQTILELAHREDRVLITFDNDFGELVFVKRLPRPAIVRFVEIDLDGQIAAMNDLLANYADQLEQKAFVTVTKGRIRIRT